MNDFKVYADPEAVALAVADYLFHLIEARVADKGQCHVVLPGGTTPARCLEILANKPLPWKHIHWYPSDERCYPVGHAERNDTMITARLFLRKEHNINNFHTIPAELGPEKGAEIYAALIEATGGLDIAVLGMGEDGHTASLFPGNEALQDTRSVVPVTHAPKPPSERISIGLTALKNAGECIVIATGANKREVLTAIRGGELLPVALVEPQVWFVDEAAMA